MKRLFWLRLRRALDFFLSSFSYREDGLCLRVPSSGSIRKKGFGFLLNAEGKDVFVHFSSIEGEGFRSLKDGEAVEYEQDQGPKRPARQKCTKGERGRASRGRIDSSLVFPFRGLKRLHARTFRARSFPCMKPPLTFP